MEGKECMKKTTGIAKEVLTKQGKHIVIGAKRSDYK